MTPTQLRAWRKRLALSQTRAADALGLSLRGYQKLERGEGEIRKCVALACRAVELGITDAAADAAY